MVRAPVVERVRAEAARDPARWTDTWFSPDGQVRLRAAVARLRAK
jgi:hypothetical protein